MAPRLTGVHLPASGRLRLCHSAIGDLKQGNWVKVESRYGIEGGQITVAPDLLTGDLSSEPYGRIIQRLNPEEIERAAQLAEDARTILARLVSTVGPLGEGGGIVGLRFTVQPERAIFSWYGDGVSEALEDWLSQNLSVPYILEHDSDIRRSSRLYGGLGRLIPNASSIEAIIRQRFEPAGSTDLPAGFPRLLSRVSTPHGIGIVTSVSTKHREARVKLTEDGSEISVPLGELRVAEETE